MFSLLDKQVSQYCSAAPSGTHVSICVELFVSSCVSVDACFCLNACVCVCERFCCLCNETPEVSERHSGVTEGRTGPRHRKCSCVVAPLPKPSQCV